MSAPSPVTINALKRDFLNAIHNNDLRSVENILATSKELFQEVDLVNEPVLIPEQQDITPLVYALMERSYNLDMIKLLVNSGANVNQNTPIWTAVKAAAVFKTPTVLKFILSKNPDLNKANENTSALHKAMEGTNKNHILGNCELLISSGASLHARNEEGNTPLLEAAKRGNTKVMSLIMKHYPDGIFDRNGDGKNCLDLINERLKNPSRDPDYYQYKLLIGMRLYLMMRMDRVDDIEVMKVFKEALLDEDKDTLKVLFEIKGDELSKQLLIKENLKWLKDKISKENSKNIIKLMISSGFKFDEKTLFELIKDEPVYVFANIDLIKSFIKRYDQEQYKRFLNALAESLYQKEGQIPSTFIVSQLDFLDAFVDKIKMSPVEFGKVLLNDPTLVDAHFFIAQGLKVLKKPLPKGQQYILAVLLSIFKQNNKGIQKKLLNEFLYHMEVNPVSLLIKNNLLTEEHIEHISEMLNLDKSILQSRTGELIKRLYQDKQLADFLFNTAGFSLPPEDCVKGFREEEKIIVTYLKNTIGFQDPDEKFDLYETAIKLDYMDFLKAFLSIDSVSPRLLEGDPNKIISVIPKKQYSKVLNTILGSDPKFIIDNLSLIKEHCKDDQNFLNEFIAQIKKLEMSGGASIDLSKPLVPSFDRKSTRENTDDTNPPTSPRSRPEA